MGISNSTFCNKCKKSDGTEVTMERPCSAFMLNGKATCEDYDTEGIANEINNAWEEEYSNLPERNKVNASSFSTRSNGKLYVWRESTTDLETDMQSELKKECDSNNSNCKWLYKDNDEWRDFITDYFQDSSVEIDESLIRENMEHIPQMIDDKLREFNFYTVDPKKGKMKVSFNDEDREVMKNSFMDMSEKYPEDIAFIRSVVDCRGIDDKTNQPFVRLGSYRDNSNINLPFSKRVNGLEKVLDGGINYFTIENNPGPDERDFKILPGDLIKDVEFSEEAKEEMSKPMERPQQPMKKEEPFEEVMKGKERKGLASLMEKGELTNDLTKSQKKIIEKLKREGYLFKQPVDGGGYKKMKVKSKEFTEAFEVWKKS